MAQNTYSFKLTNGKTLDVNGPEPPSDDEIEGIAKEAGVELALANTPPPTPSPILEDIQQPIGVPPMAPQGPQEPNIPPPAQEHEFNDLERQVLGLPPKEQPGLLERGYNMMFNAPEFITKPARRFSDLVTTPMLSDSPAMAQTKGFIGGAAEGLASQLSPVNLLSMGRGRLATIAARVLGGTQIAHGAHELYKGNTAEGVGDIGFGMLSALAPSLHDSAGPNGPNIPPPDVPPDVRPNGPTLPPDNMNQAAILQAIKAPIVEHPRPEGVWDNNLDLTTQPAGITPDKMFEMARQKQGMGFDVPEGMDQISGPIKEQPPVDLSAELNRFHELAAKEQAGQITPREAAEGRALHIRLQEAGAFEAKTPDIVESGAPPKEPQSDFDRQRQFFIDDSKRMQEERAAREADPVWKASQKAQMDDWNKVHRSMDTYEGNFNEPNTMAHSQRSTEGYTPDQLAVKESYDKIKNLKDEHASWFSEQEEKLPENEFFKEPPEHKAAFDAELERMETAHEELINKLDKRPDLESNTIDVKPTKVETSEIPSKTERVFRGGPLEGKTGKSFFTTSKDEAHGYASLAERPEDRLLHEGDLPVGKYAAGDTTTGGNIPESWAEIQRVVPNEELDTAFTNRAKPVVVPEQTGKATTSANRGKVQDADLAKVEATYNQLKDSKLPEEQKAASLLKGILDAKKREFPPLPRELKGAQPRYSSGKNMYEPQFKSDMDKALYIIAQDKPSAHDASYLKFVMDHTGLDEAGSRAAGKVIKGRIKEFLKTQKAGKVNVEPMFKLTEDMKARSEPIPNNLSQEEIRMQALAEARARMDTKYKGFREDEAYNPANDISEAPPQSYQNEKATALKGLLPEPAAPLLSPIEGGGGGGGKPPRKAGSGGGPREPNNPNAPPLVKQLRESDEPAANALEEAWNITKGTMAVDLPFITSAGFRQGSGLLGTPGWFKAWIPSIKAYGSKAFSEAHTAMIKNDPLAKRPTVPMLDKEGNQKFKNGRPMFEETKSILEQAGVKFADLRSPSAREETIRSALAEKIPFYGPQVIARSNRAYTAYINDLRLGAFRNMYEAMPNKNDIHALQEIGEIVNVLTGRGSLTMEIPREIGLPGGSFLGKAGRSVSLENVPVLGKIAGKKADLEGLSRTLANTLWAPKLIASRMKMLNPINYMSGSPLARQEYLKGALRTAGSWLTFAGLASQIPGVEVSLDTTSSDFGKIKIGNTRLDPGGGFQQFLVLASRLAKQEYTSSTTGQKTQFGTGPHPRTTGSTLLEFLSNKLHPRAKQFWDAAFADKNKPYHVIDREFQQWLPMLTGDLIDIAKEQPDLVSGLAELAKFAPLTSAGMGLQNYEGRDFNKPVFTPYLPDAVQENEITLGGPQ